MRRLSVVGCVAWICLASSQLWGAQPDLSSLIEDLSASKAPTRESAAESLGRFGPAAGAAVPALVDALKDKEERVRHEALNALEMIGPSARQAVPALQGIIENGPPNMKLGAIHALGAIGAEAEPATESLVAIAKGDDQSLSIAAVLTLVRIHPGKKDKQAQAVPILIKALDSKQLQIRNDAITALGEIGAPAVPELIEVLKAAAMSPILATRAAMALAAVGGDAADAVPALREALSVKNEKLQEQAAHAVGAIGPAAAPAVPDLTQLLTSKIGTVRASAAEALGQLGEVSAPAIPDLAKALSDTDTMVRREAAEALGMVGPKAQSAIPALVKALSDTHGEVTVHAASSLGRLGAPAVKAVTPLLKDESLRSLALAVLGDFGPEAKPAIPDLLPLLRDKDVDTRRETLLVLAQMGPAAQAAVPTLLTEAKNEKNPTRAGAAYALVKIGAKEVLPILMKGAQEKEDKHYKMVCAWGLLALEPKNPEYLRASLPSVIGGLTHEWDLVRRESAQALGRVGPPAKQAVSALAKVAESDKSPAVRMDALGALGEIGVADEALPAVLKSLSAPEPPIRYAACFALGKFGPSAKEAVPVLVNYLKMRDDFMPIICAWALVRIDPKQEGLADLVVEPLTRGLSLPDPQARLEAVSALELLGAAAKPALPTLKALSKDDDESVRKAAAKAVKAIGG